MTPTTGVYHITAVLLLLTTLPSAWGHGMMCTPRQRAAYSSSKCGSDVAVPKGNVIDYCAHCLNGGTVKGTANHLPASGWKVYDPIKDFAGSARRSGLCGDPVGRKDHMIGGSFMPYKTTPRVAHYKPGAEVDFVAEIDTNHNGYFEYFLCDLDSCGSSDINEKCFTGGHCHRLLRVPHKDCENPSKATHTECGPIDPVYPGRWYLPCRKTGHVGVHIVGGESGTMRYKLPEGVKCKHCVVQWYWATANSCAPRGYKEYIVTHKFPFGKSCPSDGGGQGAYSSGMVKCGGSKLPEEFWSCADVVISEDGDAAGKATNVENTTDDSQPSDDEDNKTEQTPADESESRTDDDKKEQPAASDEPDKENEDDDEKEKSSEYDSKDSDTEEKNKDQSEENQSDSGISDEEEVKKSPEKVMKKAEEELRKDIEDTANKSKKEEEREHKRAEEGKCVAEDSPCDGKTPCCDVQQVCVYTARAGGFTCRFWWGLREEVVHREKEEDVHKKAGKKDSA